MKTAIHCETINHKTVHTLKFYDVPYSFRGILQNKYRRLNLFSLFVFSKGKLNRYILVKVDNVKEKLYKNIYVQDYSAIISQNSSTYRPVICDRVEGNNCFITQAARGLWETLYWLFFLSEFLPIRYESIAYKQGTNGGALAHMPLSCQWIINWNSYER